VDTPTAAAGFWSYAHEDDTADSGGILELAARLRDEFSLLTGESLSLFVDRSDISWGDEWQRRIENALVQTTFFIPVITPRYFKRPECRRELISFVGQAESLGITELILPILYGDVVGLAPDSEDEAIALVGRTQYVDWRSLRLAGSATPEYRTAVNALAKRLIEIASIVATRQMENELRRAQGDMADDEADLASVLQRVDALLPGWLDAVTAERTVDAQHMATLRVHRDRLSKLERTRAPASARFVELRRYASEELPLAQRLTQLAHAYLTKTIELDPPISALLRIARSHSDSRPVALESLASIDEVIENIHRHDDLDERGGWVSMQEFARKHEHISRTMRQLRQLHEVKSQLVDEANALVQVWHNELHFLRESAEQR
jgi:hypothetical protein